MTTLSLSSRNALEETEEAPEIDGDCGVLTHYVQGQQNYFQDKNQLKVM